MLHDARSLQADSVLDYDICIIGAGAAGITLAMELRGSGRKICLLESGGLDFDPDVQAMYAGSSSAEVYPDIETSRLRYFGGTTNHWVGSTQRFGALDFEHRKWMAHSGWPITRYDLEEYYDRAHPYLELPPPDYRLEPILQHSKLKPFPMLGESLRYAVGFSSPPTRFGEVYRADLEAADDIDVYLNANVTEIVAAADGLGVRELSCAVLDGPAFTARAATYVLATGGIENARLLLVSRSVHANGLGNAHDVVGRYYMDHPVVGFGVLHPSLPLERMKQFLGVSLPPGPAFAVLELTDREATRRQIGGMRIPFATVSRYFASAGIESYHTLTEDFLGQYEKGLLWDDIGNIIGDIDMVIEAMSRRLFSTRLFDSAEDREFFFFDSMLEQEPDPDNRIVLQAERDALGLQRVRVNWRLTDLDRRTVRETATAFGEWVAAAGLGRLRLLLEHERTWSSQLSFGDHHCGATRMGDDPKRSVVDRHHKVHGLANLYVAGSSVFPTAGHVPVTLTIVATTIRLADHLKSVSRG